MKSLEDGFGRRFSYLRLSITDACNLRCTYCLPNGYKRSKDFESYLSLSEIRNLANAFAELGMWKIRLTGGEPTLRRDLTDIARMLSGIPGIRKIALSTNGYQLKQTAKALLSSGISALNISVDSLIPEKFAAITGRDILKDVLAGIDAALMEGFLNIKINAVLLGGWNEEDFSLFQEWIRDRPLTVRFIELMPTGQTAHFFKKHHVSGETIRDNLLQNGWTPRAREEGDGPAIEFKHPNYRGSMGLIAPYSKHFCSTCNRLRVTSQGGLRLCLFGEGNHSLRHLLQNEAQKEELKNLLCSILQKKEVSHYLPEGRYGINQTFSSIGG
ncbi:MAG: GTP 3',8-cyclase MoaA [Bdellovibrionia bacterium]